MSDQLKVLTIRQPWASLIMAGIKDVENRTWSTKLRGRFLIHASAIVKRSAWGSFRVGRPDHDDFHHASAFIKSGGLPLGAILGTVELTDVVTESDSPWFVGPVGFTLANPQSFAEPIPESSFWTQDDDLQALIDAAITAQSEGGEV